MMHFLEFICIVAFGDKREALRLMHTLCLVSKQKGKDECLRSKERGKQWWQVLGSRALSNYFIVGNLAASDERYESH